MARLPRKLTTTALGSYQVRWLRDEAEREGDADLARTCGVALSIEGDGGLKLREIQHARKIVVDEINRRVGHPSVGSKRSIGVAKPAAQLEREIKAIAADPFASLPAGPKAAVSSGPTFRTRAAFMLPGHRGWTWKTWSHRHPSKHAAIIEMAKELGATGWDFGQGDHGMVGEVNF